MKKDYSRIKNFEIHGFKKFERLKLEDLGRINLFLGNNNVGKTSILEAIYAYSCGQNVSRMISDCFFRNKRSKNEYDFLEKIIDYANNKDELPITFSFSAEYEDGQTKRFSHEIFPISFLKLMEHGLVAKWKVKTSGGDDRHVPLIYPLTKDDVQLYHACRFVDVRSGSIDEENIELYRKIDQGHLKEFQNDLSKVFPDVENIEMMYYPDGIPKCIGLTLHEKGFLPLHSFGDGMKRWFNILGGMVVYQEAIHCIEGLNTDVHYVAQKNLSINMLQYAEKYNNQIFMTIHNLEFVDHLLDGVYGTSEAVEDSIRIYTLKENANGEIKVRKLTGKEAYEGRKQYKLELR